MASGTNLRINSVSDLNKIPDLVTAFDIMNDLNIDSSDVCNMADALNRIKESFSQSSAQLKYQEQGYYSFRDGFARKDRVLKEAVNADVSNRKSLRTVFERARDYLDKLPRYFLDDLQRMFPDVTSNLDSTLKQLEKNDCIILVAGEQGSGKSSLVNLVAGDKILPTDLLRGTKTICELRHSKTKRFVLHRWDSKYPPAVKECRHENDVDAFLQELTHHVTLVERETNKSPYEKIEIYWPLPILGEGVVMVDSPGIGESRKVSQQLEVYMSQAFGFIYVLNISNAGGLHKDRLGQLLRRATERSEGVDLSTALFVCNWWDQVPLPQRDHVMDGTLRRLSMVWSGVRRQQVFPISSTEAQRAVERGDMLEEHRDLVQAIRRVLPTTFNAKLSVYYRWLSAVLKRSLYSLKISSNMDRQEMVKKEATFVNVRNQIEALETDAGHQIEYMRDGFKREVDNITRKVIAYMRSEACQIAIAGCVAPECDSKKFAKEAASRFYEHLANVLDVFEAHSGFVSKMKANILKTFQRNLDLFEDQIKKIEGVMFDDKDNHIITDLHNSMRSQMPVRNVWRRARMNTGGKNENGCFSMGNAISGCKQLDVKSNAVKNVLKTSGSPAEAMASVSVLFLQQFKDEDVTSAVKKFFERIAKRFDAASRLLPEFLKADRNLLQTLQTEVKGEQQMLADMYPKLMSTCSNLQGTLDMFYVQRLMFFEFDMSQLKYDARQPIGRGTFADVFCSTVSDGEVTQTVALKMQRDKLTSRNVTEVLLEDRILREVRHENIISYYGAAKEIHGGDLRWVMVLGYCTRTIKQRFLSEDTNVPGRQEIVSLQLDAMRDVANFASQICSGLCFMHNKGYVHRDLKSENILLDKDDVVKLTDVGLSKAAVDISGSLAGTPVYMAPEVLLQKGNYDMKADVYSLAIILWELWYGKDAADHISSHLFGRLGVAVEKGLRPSMTQSIKPPEDWQNLIRKGWEFEASKRPSSREMADFFESFLENTKA